ncbi:MAG: hemolysin family protein [Gammaproteobacteria bacterium]|nr:hemolysin family protein [Gammaproteobacteria bacterium]MDH3372985.1 hemolysin family protein [Gammaproteobacteria bacterium]MDH3408127.1 hemolysin family protein [Gammaproteobacteria bacterium]
MTSTSMSVAAIVALLLANAFFVAAEFALVKAKPFRLNAKADAGSKAAGITVKMQQSLEPYLAACQLGITMASLGLGWIGEPAVAALLKPLFELWSLPDEFIHQVSFLVGFLMFSSLHIVLGEQVPKSFGIRQSERVSIWIAYPLLLFFIVSFPLTWLLDRASRAVLSLFGVEEGTHADILTLAELKDVVATSSEHGKISNRRALMLKNLIELDDRPVAWVMIPRKDVNILKLGDSEERNLAVISETKHSRFPLLDGDNNENVVGIVVVKLLHQAMMQGDAHPASHLADFTRDTLVIPERQTVSRAFETLRSRAEHMAVVADEYGEFAGIITIEDLLEEVVGDISDEKDVSKPHAFLEQLGEHAWIADGGMTVADAQREFGLEIERTTEVNTLSGLFMEKLGRIPEVGDVMDIEQLRLTIESVEDRHATRILVSRAQSFSTE